MENKKMDIQEVKNNISEALDNWAEIMLSLDATGNAFYIDYDEKDMLNALFIFNHVWQNRAIKRGVFDEKNAEEKMTLFKKAISDIFQVDTIELAKNVMEKSKEE